MLDIRNESAGIKVAPLTDEARELTVGELNSVSGGDIGVVWTVGADSWIITADARGYSVDHVHIGK
jgi:hypothetical protein